MAEYTAGMSIDGKFFDIPFISIKRKAEFLDKYAKRTQDGILRRELIGVYYNYTMSIGTIDDVDTYKALWDKLTEPEEFHEVVVPDVDGTYRYKAYVAGVSDEFERILGNKAVMKGLTCEFIAQRPARTP